MTVQKDEQFYMTLVTIQVENHLFRVPKQSLESQSKIFRDMFSLPVAEDTEGSHDNNPVRLDGIKTEEFKRFLEVLFMGACEETTKQRTMFESWFPVIKLARMWEFSEVHRYAVKQMPYHQVHKDPAEKVALAVQYDIRQWLLPGLTELAKRQEPLGVHDLEFLGAELALKVAAIRESLTVRNGGLVSGTRDVRAVDFTPVIKRNFPMSDYDAA